MTESISAAQVRAARAFLDWSLVDLANAARVSVATVRRFEDNATALVSSGAMTLMQDALETEGVRFLVDDGNGPGVRFRPR